MSLRTTNRKNSNTSVSDIPQNISNASRLAHVLAAGRARQAAPIAMMGGHSMGATPYQARKCLFIKGLVFGIPEEKLEEAVNTAKNIITKNGITTICWDGDKLGHVGPKNEPAPMSFTFVIQELAQWSNINNVGLEFVYFKKTGKAKGLITGDGFGKVAVDEGALKHGTTQYIGPMDFLTPENTIIVDAGAGIPAKHAGMNLGIEFSGEMKWYELGLKGLALAKSHFHNHEVSYLVVGLGGAVKKELEKVEESIKNGESKYPHLAITKIEVNR